MLLIALGIASAGCDRVVGRMIGDRRGAPIAAAAEKKASDDARDLEHQPVRTSEGPPREDLRDVAEEVRREREDVAEAAARERVQYKQRIAKELSAADKRMIELGLELARATGTARGSKERDLSEARAWRNRLKHDFDDIERVGEDEWPEVRDRIEHDIEDERPASVPRGFDKSYAI